MATKRKTASKTARKTSRGSAKLFALKNDDHVGIAKALGMARSDYEVKWWWKYGQPAIDLIKAQLQVDTNQLGPVVSQLMHLNSPNLQVTAYCFPYGIPYPEWYRIEVNLRNAIGR
ncbi:MAG: hypothetical protein ABIQ36_09470 [Rhodanobacter sp.]